MMYIRWLRFTACCPSDAIQPYVSSSAFGSCPFPEVELSTQTLLEFQMILRNQYFMQNA